MKRKLMYLAGLILVSCSFTSCELLSGNCEVCALVSRDSYGNFLSSEAETEYCDEELLAIKAIGPVTTGGVTTGYECN